MNKGWKRVNQCVLCGCSRCVVSAVNPRVAYCFRFSKRFFINRDGTTNEDKRWRKKQADNQCEFDFGNSNLRAIEGSLFI